MAINIRNGILQDDICMYLVFATVVAGEAATAVQCPSGGVNDRVGALANRRRAGQEKRKGLTRGNRQPQTFGIVYRARAVGWRQ